MEINTRSSSVIQANSRSEIKKLPRDRVVSVRDVPRPFLKWVGGKGQLLQALMSRVDRCGKVRGYHEPFVGGGALFFELIRSGRITRTPRLTDVNQRLIETYQVVRDQVDDLVRLLLQHQGLHSESYYYQVRSIVPDSALERAARVIYLNKTCFNWLYRENSKGFFNTPFGRYVNPTICDAPNLRSVSEALARTELASESFEGVLLKAEPGDLVYFDPPYLPVSATSCFTSYSEGGFTLEDQKRLAATFHELATRDVHVMLSNSMTDWLRNTYSAFEIDDVWATRAVNSRADRRGKVCEAIVRNF